jgi:hypothetical protein
MHHRGAARPSTTPGPGPRAGRCAAPAPPTANARRDPGPIVGSLRRLGWGRGHDASRPGGSGAGTARRRALDRHSPARRHARTARALLATQGGWPRSIHVTARSYALYHRCAARSATRKSAGEPTKVLVRRLHSLERVRTAQTASLTLSRAKRCADRRFPRSHVSVRGQGMRSTAAPEPGMDASPSPSPSPSTLSLAAAAFSGVDVSMTWGGTEAGNGQRSCLAPPPPGRRPC